MMQKDIIIKQNKAGHDNFLEVVKSLTAEQIETPNVLENWGVKEIIAHLSGWHEIVLSEIELILKGIFPDTIGLSDVEVSIINAKEIAKRKSLDFEETLLDLERTFSLVENKLKSLSQEDINRVVCKGDKKISIEKIFDYRYKGENHTQAHASQIRKFFDCLL